MVCTAFLAAASIGGIRVCHVSALSGMFACVSHAVSAFSHSKQQLTRSCTDQLTCCRCYLSWHLLFIVVVLFLFHDHHVCCIQSTLNASLHSAAWQRYV